MIRNALVDAYAHVKLWNEGRWGHGKIKTVLAYPYKGLEHRYLSKHYDPKKTMDLYSLNECPKNFLADMTLNDRLDIISHGNEQNGLAEISCADLFRKLHEYGLREVGVIKFQSCHVGKGPWLKRTQDTLDVFGIRYAWLAAPTGALLYSFGFKTIVGGSNDGKLKIVRGSINKNFPGTRYS
ncbi:hypothetical protein GCM10009504_05350 [Pseudomonas laurentiana]|uniref:hypothetical protein n=1 Tax=Pseudomonas laurentiana TaxID=2364649 RepID=UPI00167346BA|nr:hypothetical protein [Pseudomonas laurentiana]GGU51616.1 hypothetical protein GCM10009504_05350 [Pseudomonas laurentiana]